MRQFTGISHPGDGRGRSLGFSTANITLDDPTDRPPDGIYAIQVQLNDDQKQYPGVMHVGPRPTFDASATVEVYILDFPDRDLYETHFTIQLVQKIRDIAKFSSTVDLIAAMQNDCQQARKILVTQLDNDSPHPN